MAGFGGAIVDVDGTLVRGDRLLPGAREGLNALQEASVEPLLFSNNPTKSGSYYRSRLESCGLSVGNAQVLTAAVVTGEYLAREHPDATCYVVGEAGLRDELISHGVTIDPDPKNAEVVVGSIDREFHYDTLSEALVALRNAETFVGTDPDRTIPTETDVVPGSGAIIAAMVGTAEREPDVVAGKPSSVAADAAVGRLGVPAENCLVVGDRLDTDLALGAKTGMTTVLVLTGVTDRNAVAASDVDPDYVLDSIGDIRRVLADGEREDVLTD